ncbi:MAG: hypothetical protein IKC49_03170 [Clostridia bacterium]|nr:hypothetical protein [Clostridia bacterium]
MKYFIDIDMISYIDEMTGDQVWAPLQTVCNLLNSLDIDLREARKSHGQQILSLEEEITRDNIRYNAQIKEKNLRIEKLEAKLKEEHKETLKYEKKYESKIEELEAKLSEKEKELKYKSAECEKWQHYYENCSNLEKQMSPERQYCLDNWRACEKEKYNFAVHELEKTRMKFLRYFWEKEDYLYKNYLKWLTQRIDKLKDQVSYG